jgi:hypothetical protein
MNNLSVRKPLIATFLTCVLLGPPVGGIVIGLGLVGDQGVLTALLSSLAFAPFSYVSGGLSALTSGVAMTAYGGFKGKPPLWFALVCAVATFAVLQSVQNDQARGYAVMLLTAHIVSGLVCWLVFSRFWTRYELAAATHTSRSLAGIGEDKGVPSLAGRGKSSQ